MRRRASRVNSNNGTNAFGERSRLISGGSGYNSATGRHNLHHSPLISNNQNYSNNSYGFENNLDNFNQKRLYEVV